MSIHTASTILWTTAAAFSNQVSKPAGKHHPWAVEQVWKKLKGLLVILGLGGSFN
jgi:hypothetical protein